MFVPRETAYLLLNLILRKYFFYHYKKIDSKTRKITQLCQLNLLIIDYPTKLEKDTNWYMLKK